MLLEGKRILVTHVTHWAGPEICAALGGEGAEVLCHDPSFTDAAAGATFCGKAAGLTALSAQEPSELVAEALASGPLDVLVNNDAYPAIKAKIEDADPAALRDSLEALVVAPFRLTGAVVPHFKERGKGKIIFLTSASALVGIPNYSMYVTARAATNGLAKTLALELGRDNIQVNAIAANYVENPDYFPPELLANEEAYKKIVKNIPLGRLGKPEEAADLVAFYASDKSDFITGNVVPFAGGWA